MTTKKKIHANPQETGGCFAWKKGLDLLQPMRLSRLVYTGAVAVAADRRQFAPVVESPESPMVRREGLERTVLGEHFEFRPP